MQREANLPDMKKKITKCNVLRTWYYKYMQKEWTMMIKM